MDFYLIAQSVSHYNLQEVQRNLNDFNQNTPPASDETVLLVMSVFLVIGVLCILFLWKMSKK